jgi:hypothetical protein
METRRVNPWFRLAIIAALLPQLLSMAACQANVTVVRTAPEMLLVNRSDAAVAVVVWRPCGEPERPFALLARVDALPGRRALIHPVPGCVDLEARGNDGLVMGRLPGIEMVPGTIWEIR